MDWDFSWSNAEVALHMRLRVLQSILFTYLDSTSVVKHMHRWRSGWFPHKTMAFHCFNVDYTVCLNVFCVNIISTQITLRSSNIKLLCKFAVVGLRFNLNRIPVKSVNVVHNSSKVVFGTAISVGIFLNYICSYLYYIWVIPTFLYIAYKKISYLCDVSTYRFLFKNFQTHFSRVAVLILCSWQMWSKFRINSYLETTGKLFFFFCPGPLKWNIFTSHWELW